jgi:hypothetical protein
LRNIKKDLGTTHQTSDRWSKLNPLGATTECITPRMNHVIIWGTFIWTSKKWLILTARDASSKGSSEAIAVVICKGPFPASFRRDPRPRFFLGQKGPSGDGS